MAQSGKFDSLEACHCEESDDVAIVLIGNNATCWNDQ
jgi:hypothetical protein